MASSEERVRRRIRKDVGDVRYEAARAEELDPTTTEIVDVDIDSGTLELVLEGEPE